MTDPFPLKCSRAGCNAPATIYPRLMVPCIGIPLDLQQPCWMLMSVPSCAAHLADLPPAAFLDTDPELRATIENYVWRVHGLPADFARAYMSSVPIDGPEGAYLERQGRDRLDS